MNKFNIKIALVIIISIAPSVVFLERCFFYYQKRNAAECSDCGYFFEFGFNKDADAFKIDENNVVFIDYSDIKSLGVRNTISYNPISIALSGLRFRQQNKYELYLSQANWLLENISESGSWLIRHNKRVGNKELKAPWVSGLSQGLGMSVLVRAYQDTQDIRYLNAAEAALKPFQVPIKEGGVRSKTDFGFFYEEYPFREHPTQVLNGFIYSLFGLYDLYMINGNLTAKALFDDGVQTLIQILPEYNLGSWSRYDLNDNAGLREHWGYSSPWYQKLHYVQLDALYKITKKDEILKYANEFKIQSEKSWVNLVIYPAYVIYADIIVKIIRFF